ncbi:MAG TPA: hypothetical protein VFD01_07530 [Candidatus Dormibacteraeota bacterium]|nr:hypothetical protein [Candidatus Dormibacteraeota bacterium]
MQRGQAQARPDQHQEAAHQEEVGQALAGIAAPFVAAEASGEDGRRPAYPPLAVTGVPAQRLLDEHGHPPAAQQERHERRDGERPTLHVQADVRQREDPGQRAGVPLLAQHQPPPGEQQGQGG